MIDLPSPNHDARPLGVPIDILVVHYTGMRTANEALARLCDPTARVSAHYTIDTGGTVYRHVDESRRAWHAGVSYWAGRHNVNGRSIGIELVNPGHEFGYVPFAEAQIAELIALAQGIVARHPVPPRNVLGHSDVAPARKMDPGELFPWQRLAAAGIGIFPPPCAHGCPGKTAPLSSPSMGEEPSEAERSAAEGEVICTPPSGAPVRATSPMLGEENSGSARRTLHLAGNYPGARRLPRTAVPCVGEEPSEAERSEAEGRKKSMAHLLGRFGYGVPPDVDVPLSTVVAAFQRHFRQERVDGVVDAETEARLAGLLEMTGETGA